MGICLAVCLLLDFDVARTLLPNSDAVQSFNEMISIRNGNVLLHHWVLATDNFVLTDLLPMAVTGVLVGKDTRLIFVVPFLVFASMLLASILIVRRCTPTPRGRLAGSLLVLLLLGFPYGVGGNFFFWSDFHVATITACLLAVLAIAPAFSGLRFSRFRLLPFAILVFAASFSDPLADFLLVGPIVLVTAARAWLGTSRIDEGLVAASALVGAVGGSEALAALVGSGASFTVQSSVSFHLVADAHALVAGLGAMLGGEQVLFTARAKLIRPLPMHGLIAGSRLLTAYGVALLCCTTIWQTPRSPRGGVAQLLVAGALCVAVPAAFSTTFADAVSKGADYPGAAVRFAVPVFVFLAVAAALKFGDIAGELRSPAPLAIAGAALAVVYVGGAASASLQAAGRPAGTRAGPDAALAAWLLRARLSYGVGDYWDTQLVEALTGGAVKADAVLNVGGPLQPWRWLNDTSRFGRRPPQFAIIRPGGRFHVDLPSIVRSYGTPVSITEVANLFFVARLKTDGNAGVDGASPDR